MNEIMGKPWAIPITGGGKSEWIPWRASNKDMEYQAYQEWLLKKMCANYQISPKELGIIEDVNRSTAEDASESESEKGIQPLLTMMADYFEVEIIGEHGLGVGDYVKFAWDEAEDSEDVIDQRFSVRVSAGAATRAEWREAVGMEPGESEGLDEFFTDVELKLLPSTPEDMEALSPAAMQERKTEEARERFAELSAGSGSVAGTPGEKNAGSAPEFGSPEEQETGGLGKVRDQPNPQMVARQQHAESVFEDASSHLMAELEEILGMPLHKTVGLPERRRVRLAELRVDTDYQRPEDREKVESMHRRLKAGGVLEGDIKVNEREDGSLWITDGQHRVKARMLNGETEAEALVTRLPQQHEQMAANLVTAHE